MHYKQIRPLFILAFPCLLTIGILLIPVVTNYTNHALAEQAVHQTTRWFLGHLLAALAFALSILAVNAIGSHLLFSSRSLPVFTLPLISLGAALYAFGLGADGIGPLAVQTAGSSPALFFDGSSFWVTGTFIAATLIFGFGLLSLVMACIQQELLKGWRRYGCFGSVLAFMAAPMILSGWALYGVALAAFGIFVPLAWDVHQESR